MLASGRGWVKGDELVCAYHGWRYGAVAVAYRKAMRGLGLAASTSIGITAE